MASGSKVLILLGAGATGSYILSNTQVNGLVSDLSKVLSKHLKEGNGEGSSNSDYDGVTVALTAQVKRLSQELHQLASMQSRPIVVNSSQTGAGGGLLGSILPVVALGAVGYGFMWWKGIKFGDLMYVTKRGMNLAVESFTKQMEGLTSALAATKRQLSGRLDGVSKSVNETAVLTSQVKDELCDAKNQLGMVGQNVVRLQDDLGDVKDTLSSLESKQEVATQGIILLCRYVVDGLQGRDKTELLEGLHSYTRGPMAKSLSFGQGGLKDLTGYQGMILPQKPASVCAGNGSSMEAMTIGTQPTGLNGVSTFMAPRPTILTRNSSSRTSF